ncbi:hypothetical protein [Estrella lausannensis]|uniref:hypothetical protein n=1 Tax=Estrella lausannensis TaxID=483423 RepID=UPI00117B1A08|nr:hypothetical protein [Estrella lausannensis]
MKSSPGEGIESYVSIWQGAHDSLQASPFEIKGKIVLVATYSGILPSNWNSLFPTLISSPLMSIYDHFCNRRRDDSSGKGG